MTESTIRDDPKRAIERLVQACRSNPLLARFGFAATDDLLVQIVGNKILLRRRNLLGEAACPVCILQVTPREKGAQIYTATKISADGKLVLAASQLVLLIPVILFCLAPSLGLSFPAICLVLGLTLLGAFACLGYIWGRFLFWLSSTRAATAAFLRTVWPELNPYMQASTAPAVDRPSQVTAPGASVKPALAPLPDPPVEGTSDRVFLKLPAPPLLQLQDRLQGQTGLLIAKLGFGNKHYFSTQLKGDYLLIRRVRPTNSMLFRALTHFLDLDFGPELKITTNGAANTVNIGVRTALVRKLWMIFVYTLAIGLGGIGALLTLIGIAFHDVYSSIVGTMMLFAYGGGAWSVLDMRSRDRGEYLLLLEQLGETLPELAESP